MHRFLFAILGAVLLNLSVVSGPKAQGSPDGALESTVLGQIEALKLRDYGTAFEYASDGIKAYFGTPENFAIMLNSGYQMVLDPAEVEFLENRPDGLAVWQRVMVTAPSGEEYLLDYQMVPDHEGWKINAVVHVEPTMLAV
ncbi:DUF4864 domain-containing protein [Halocynthiibacter sp. C4]|uniref:DUF4864 domain-containing protein n=1 Tax=Halocynthiibacter sp. C4 TaxID=2992758 RepID=UPI00237C0A7C|nr:DUF4864 domain-containing protein [Halocynthiibacter sp. C4]MDE0590462.1 DUF4864 domain-containing protein [Halocynthiibacter sp. C4]